MGLNGPGLISLRRYFLESKSGSQVLQGMNCDQHDSGEDQCISWGFAKRKEKQTDDAVAIKNITAPY